MKDGRPNRNRNMLNTFAKKFFILFLFFSFALLSCTAEDVQEEKKDIKQTIEKFVITETKDGNIKTILESDFAEINEDKKTARLTEPKVKFYEDGKYHSLLIADTGEVDMETNNIKASGKCVIDTVNGEHLETSDVTYDANKKIISSDSNIKITRQDGVIYGKGFQSDTDLKNIVIKNERIIID